MVNLRRRALFGQSKEEEPISLVYTFDIREGDSLGMYIRGANDDNVYSVNIDGVELGKVTQTWHTFTTRGIHTVKYRLTDVTKIPALSSGTTNLISSFFIPDTVTSIPYNFVAGATRITEITETNLGKGITSTGGYAFKQTSIQELVYPEGFKSEGGACVSCANLKRIIYPSTTTSIWGSLVNNPELESVLIYATTPPTTSTSAIGASSTSYILYVPEQSVATYKNHNVWGALGDRIKPISEYQSN